MDPRFGPRCIHKMKHSSPCICGSFKPGQFGWHAGHRHLQFSKINKIPSHLYCSSRADISYLGQQLFAPWSGVGLKHPTHGKYGKHLSSSFKHHFGPITSGDSMNMTLLSGISRVATKYRPSSSEYSILNGRHMILWFGQSLFWCSAPQ